MNAADLPPELAQPATPGLMDAVRSIAQGSLAGRAYAIDRGAYPVDLLKQLAAAGAMSEMRYQVSSRPNLVNHSRSWVCAPTSG